MTSDIKDFILCAENAITDELCEYCLHFFETYQHYHQTTEYGVGENTKTIKLPIYKDCYFWQNESYHLARKELIKKIRPIIETFIRNHCNTEEFKYIYEMLENKNLVFSQFQLRKMYGPTRAHSDNIDPILYTMDTSEQVVYTRIATMILVMNETNDTLHFPFQNRTVPMHKGSVLLFLPFWNYKHYSSMADSQNPRFCLQFWLMEKHDDRYSTFKEQSII